MWRYINIRDYSDEIGLVVLYNLNRWFFAVSKGLKIYYKNLFAMLPRLRAYLRHGGAKRLNTQEGVPRFGAAAFINFTGMDVSVTIFVID